MGRRGSSALVLAATLGASAPALAEDTVTVSGTKARDRSVAVTVIPTRDLTAPGLTAADVLRRQPGTWVTETGGYGSISTAQIRGGTAAQLPVYLGPVRLNDDLGGTADLSLVPLWMVEHVEVYRGHAPALADEPGIAGAVLFEPRRPRRTEWALGGGVGSFHAKEIHGRAAFGDSRASALVGLRLEGADNDYTYEEDGGLVPGPRRRVTRLNADARVVDLWAMSAAAPTPRTRVDVLMNALSREHGLPGIAAIPALRARAEESRGLLAATVRLPCGSSDTCTVSATSTVYRSGADYFDPDGELAFGAARSRVRAARIEQMAVLRVAATPRVRLSALVRGARETLDTAADDARLSHRGVARAVGLLEWDATNDVALHLHVNGTCNATDTAGKTSASTPLCARDSPSARAGASLVTGPVTWLASAGRYTRVPSLGELYGLSGTVRGNPALRSETGLTADLGVRGSRGIASVELFGFVRVTDDLVAYRRATFGYVSPYNVGRSRAIGAEIELGLAPWKELALKLPVSVLDPRDTSPERQLTNDVVPFRSRFIAAPRLLLRPAPLGMLGFDANEISVTYLYQTNRYADPAGLVVIPAQGSLDVEIEILALQRHVAARARASNLTGERRFDIVGYPLPGRAFFGSMELSF